MPTVYLIDTRQAAGYVARVPQWVARALTSRFATRLHRQTWSWNDNVTAAINPGDLLRTLDRLTEALEQGCLWNAEQTAETREHIAQGVFLAISEVEQAHRQAVR